MEIADGSSSLAILQWSGGLLSANKALCSVQPYCVVAGLAVQVQFVWERACLFFFHWHLAAGATKQGTEVEPVHTCHFLFLFLVSVVVGCCGCVELVAFMFEWYKSYVVCVFA